jgi:uroporphyrinogen-III synthase
VCAPSVRELLRVGDFRPVLQRVVASAFDVVVVLTAAACDALFDEANRHGALSGVVDALARTTIAARGPKPLLSLRRRGLTARVVTEKPHTTDELVSALSALDVARARVLLLHFGEPSDTVSTALKARGAHVEDLLLYEWSLPDDVGPLRTLISETIAGRVDAMLFTSQIQWRHLFQVADADGLAAALTKKLRDDVVVGSVGPVCSRALRAAGVVPDVMPHLPNGPSLVQALADYYAMFTPPEETTS